MNNNQAWESIFLDNDILNYIEKECQFKISSRLINEYKESRLMAKIDHQNKLPSIFKDNNLSILPVSRQEYIIGCFNIHHPVKYPNLLRDSIVPVSLPDELNNLETFKYENLSSETAAINVAFNTGMINYLLGEPSLPTISGRMSTGSFSFLIYNSKKQSQVQIDVNRAQCEIDGGFESESYFAIIEAKNYMIDDFCIRQLYYPYRLWSEKINKKVIPIIMTYSNDIFSFFVYEFSKKNEFNSIKLVDQKHFIIDINSIGLNDVSEIVDKISFVPPDDSIPFPQANTFERLVDILNLLSEKDMTKQEITEHYQFDKRQTDYYTNAARYLRLIERSKLSKRRRIFYLTDETMNVISSNHKNRVLYLIKKILSNEIFYKSFKLLNQGDIPSLDDIISILKNDCIELSDTTIRRRAGTIKSWITWIVNQIND